MISSEHSASSAKTERPQSLCLYLEEDKRDNEEKAEDVQSVDSIETNVGQEERDVPEMKEELDEVENEKEPRSIPPTPSCGQEVSGNQPAHLDLKFYHSPLW